MAEKEYIEREALIDKTYDIRANGNLYRAIFYDDVILTPAADVVKVVRCKDCNHYDKEYHQCKLHSEEPDQYSTGFIFCMSEDDFCSYGERKELDNQ